MKFITILLTFLYIFNFNYSLAQQFLPVGQGFNLQVRTLFADTITGNLYAGGNFTKLATGENMWHISVWNGSSWDSLDGGCQDGGIVFGIAKLGSDIYVGGSINIFGLNNYRGIAKWDAGIWHSIGDVITRYGNGGIRSLKTNNQELYVVGTLDSADGQPASKVAKWNGSSWYTYPVLDSTGNGLTALTSEIYNNELYVAGQFSGQSSTYNLEDLAKFDGSQWVSVGNGLSGLGYVSDMIVFQGELYVGGSFQVANGDPGNGIAKWNGTNWSSLGSGTNAYVNDLEIFNNELYVAGAFTNAGGIPVTYLAKWDGANWHDVGGIFDYPIHCLSATSSDLFIGGSFTEINGITVNRIAKYSIGVGINEILEDKFNVYPTVSTGTLNIYNNYAMQYPNQTFEIIDQFNSIVYSSKLPTSIYSKVELPTSLIGHYLFVAKIGNYIIQENIIIIR